MPKATFLKSAWYIQSNLHVRPPLVSDHLPYATISVSYTHLTLPTKRIV